MFPSSSLARVLALCSVGLVSACQQGPAPDTLLAERPLSLRSVKWNAKEVPTGKIAAVADLSEDTVVFSEQGALVFTAGLLLNTDPATKSWKAATVIPAGDRAGSQTGEERAGIRSGMEIGTTAAGRERG